MVRGVPDSRRWVETRRRAGDNGQDARGHSGENERACLTFPTDEHLGWGIMKKQRPPGHVSIGKFFILATYTYTRSLLDGCDEDDARQRGMVAAIMGAQARLGIFRDIHAVDGRPAVVLSIGPGEQSRLYRTADGGSTWETRYVNRDPKGFLDAIAFWDAGHGLVFGDPVGGRFVVLRTDDAGKTWAPTAPDAMPMALATEGAFAASGTCLVTGPDGHAWSATGGAKKVGESLPLDGRRSDLDRQ